MRSFWASKKEAEKGRGSAATPPMSPKPSYSPSNSPNATPLSPSSASVRSSDSSRDGRSAMEIRLEKRMQAEKLAKEVRQHAMGNAGKAEAAAQKEEIKPTTPSTPIPHAYPSPQSNSHYAPAKVEETPKPVQTPSPQRDRRQTSAMASRFDEPTSTRKAPSRPPRPTEAQLPPLPPMSPPRHHSETIPPALPASPPPRASLPPVPVMRVNSPHQSPPPVPDKSPRRVSSTKRGEEDLRSRGRSRSNRSAEEELPNAWSQTTEKSLSAAIAQLELDGTGRPEASRTSTAPNFVNNHQLSPIGPKRTFDRQRSAGQGSIPKAKANRPLSVASSASNTSTISSDNKVSKSNGSVGSLPRSNATAAIKAALEDIGERDPSLRERRATDGELRSGGDAIATTPPAQVGEDGSPVRLPWKRTRRGETMSMLLETGFFPPPDELEELKLSVNLRKAMPPSLIRIPAQQLIKDRELPDTPGSIASTPTELYSGGIGSKVLPKRILKTRGSRLHKRSPLSKVAATNVKSNADTAFDAEAARLSAIPESALSVLASKENSPPASVVSSPAPTQIQLRNGSVVTINTPESTAWLRHAYIQGPIRLNKTAVTMRKDSIASLEPFQETVDRLYQDTLTITRRRSEDATIDEICDFFDEFDFEDIGYGGDSLGAEDVNEQEAIEAEVDEMELDANERFTTPPTEVPSDDDKVAPKPVPKPPIPPIPIAPPESQEQLRVKGIARLSHLSGKSNDSAPSTRSGRDSVMSEAAMTSEDASKTQQPEITVLEMVEETAGYGARPDQGGFDWDDDDVEEVDGGSAWLAPGTLPRNAAGRVWRVARHGIRSRR
ncbi:hypothetical protein MBLNU230_g5724t1 [Neophaeotheca triangularis]